MITREELIALDERYAVIPSRTLDAINRYVTLREDTGDFVTAVLENNLSGAMNAADDENMAALEMIVRYCYNHIPAGCWGSPEKVAAWRGQMCTSEQKPNGGDEMR